LTIDDSLKLIISNVILIGGATEISKDESEQINEIVSGRKINCWSQNDFILKYFYYYTSGDDKLSSM
jgi:hypothetical protein